MDKFAKKVTKTKLKIGLKEMRTVTKAARVKRDKIYTEGQKFAKKLKEETIVEKLESQILEPGWLDKMVE